MARMDTDYEYDDLDVPQKPRVIVKKKGGWLGKIVALLLGIVIGIVAGIGGLVGAGYYIVTQVKIKDAANTVSGLAGFEFTLSDYLSDEYADKTVLGLIESVSGTVSKISDGTGTLGDLNEISPFVGTFLQQEGGLIDMLASYGIQTTAEELMSKYIVKTEETEDFDDRYLTDYLLLKIDEMPFAKMIESLGFEGNELITTLCYGVKGVDYQIENGEYVMQGDSKALTFGDFMSAELDNRIEQLPLDAVMDTPQDEIMLTLFYGAEHRYVKTTDGVEMNQVFYTYDGVDFYDDNGDKLDLKSEPEVSGNTYNFTFKNGTEQLVTKQGDKYYAFTTDGAAVLFPKTTIGDLDGEAEDLINAITLESALQLNDQSHAILKSIAYGKNGEKRTIKDLREQGSDLINNVQLSEIIPADTQDTIIMYLLYGKENVHYSVDPDTKEITLLRKRVAIYDGKVYNEYGELIENATVNGTASYTQGETTYDLVADASLGTLQVKITDGETTSKYDAPLYYVSLNGENLYYEPTTIGDMQDATVLSSLTGRLQLKDVMDVGDNKILKHLEKETIDDLPEAINSLTIDDVFGDQFYYRTTKGSYRLNENGEPIDQNGTVVTGAKLINIKGDDTTNKDEALTGTWKYLLMERNEDGTFKQINRDYTVIQMDGMMDHMSNNVHAATVRELKLDGLVQNLSDETLKTPLSSSVTIEGLTGKNDIGDLTVTQLVQYMSAVLDIIS